MSEIVTMDMINYRGIVLPNVPFNRLSILTVESFLSSMQRSHLLTERDSREVARFIQNNIRTFTILTAENPHQQILAFWESASITQTGPGQEYMVTVLMEIFASYNGFTSDIPQDSVIGILQRLYVQMSVFEIDQLASDFNDLKKNYKMSQSYIGMPGPEKIKKMLNDLPWVIPWIVISHMDYRLVIMLVDGLATVASQHTSGTEST